MSPRKKQSKDCWKPSPGVRIVMMPGHVVSREEFFGPAFPDFSIADDGFCSGEPGSSPDGLKLNLNHHEGVCRIATCSACAQALRFEKMGLGERFKYRGRRKMTIYMKGPNQDEVSAAFVLKWPQLVDHPLLKQLILLEDLMDMSLGLHPIKKRWHLLRRLVWIFEPYTKARADRSIFTMDADAMMALVDEMHHRFILTLKGRGKQLEPDTKFKVIAQYKGWSHVQEIGQHARYGMAHKGIKAFVSIRTGDDGKRHVVIARLSRFIHWFDIDRMARIFNKMDGCTVESGQYWSGADNCVCSPRFDGAGVSDEQIIAVVSKVVDQARRRDARRILRARH